MSTAADPITAAREAADRLERTLSAANRPAGSSTQVEGMLNTNQPPAHVKAIGQKPFSLTRFFRFMATNDEASAPHEVQTLSRYKKAMKETGCCLNGNDSGWWIPQNMNEDYGGRLTSTSSAENEIREVKAVFANTRPQFDPDEARYLASRGVITKAAQSAYVDNLGGSLVQPPVQGEIIPFIRPQAAFLAAGAVAMTLPPNGRYVAPRITGAPSVQAVGESQTTPTSNLSTGQMTLTAKKLAGAVILTEEGTAFTSGTLDAIAQAELARSLGLRLDQYGFYGQGGTDIPMGLTSAEYASSIINIETTYPTCKGIGADGNTLLPQYGDIFPSLIAERSFNVDATTGAWVLRPACYSTAVGLRADAVTSGDQAGAMVDILRRFGEVGPTQWRGRRVVQTTNIKNDYTKGSGTALTDVFFGIWQYAIFASYGAIQFQQGHNGTTFLNGQIIIRGTMYGDIGLQYPPAFLHYPNVQGMSNNF
jgi:hypothetical protein